MKKTFWYLLFMVIILPTFGFTSAQAYIDFLIKNNQANNKRLEKGTKNEKRIDLDNDQDTSTAQLGVHLPPGLRRLLRQLRHNFGDDWIRFGIDQVTVSLFQAKTDFSNRFPELFWYLIQICMSRSKADTPIIRKAIRSHMF